MVGVAMVNTLSPLSKAKVDFQNNTSQSDIPILDYQIICDKQEQRDMKLLKLRKKLQEQIEIGKTLNDK